MAKESTRREFLTQSSLALTALALPFSLTAFAKFNKMTDEKNFDVIIVGGSYAGLSAAMTLGRALRKVLIIDSGNPCNKQTPHSHNFITQDGQKPKEIGEKAKFQVLKYDTVKFHTGLATQGIKAENGFEVTTQSGEMFKAKKVLFATGITDQLPAIKGFAECWGISVLHCPYCHGYEVKHQNIGLLGNGDTAFDLCKLISNWTQRLTLFTNGKSTLTKEQTEVVSKHNIKIVEKEILELQHTNGQIKSILFTDNSTKNIEAIFARVGFKQHCDIPVKLGCELTEQGHLKVDDFHKTSIKGVFAAGDNTTFFRAVSVAVSAGTQAGVFINKELIDEVFF
jgi:thioredoxin reductase